MISPFSSVSIVQNPNNSVKLLSKIYWTFANNWRNSYWRRAGFPMKQYLQIHNYEHWLEHELVIWIGYHSKYSAEKASVQIIFSWKNTEIWRKNVQASSYQWIYLELCDLYRWVRSHGRSLICSNSCNEFVGWSWRMLSKCGSWQLIY